MANYGSESHKEFVAKIAAMEVNWADAGKAEGLQIWRVENQRGNENKQAVFGIKPWPKEKYGQFFSGDSFIVLRTYKKSDALRHDIFFWIGQNSTADERGVAAYKTFELDEYLGGTPREYRVVEGGETHRFLKLFDGTVRVQQGGAASGFNTHKPKEFKPRLFHVKGKGKNCKCIQVALSASSLNQGDVFILDKGTLVIQFNGKSAGAWEKHKGAEIMAEIRSSRGRGTLEIKTDIMDDGGEGDDCAEFWDTLGGDKSSVAPAHAAGADEDVSGGDRDPVLHRVSNASGFVKFEKIKEGGLSTTDLKSEDVFIVDCGHEIFVWVGKGASKVEKREAMMHAERFLASDEGPHENSTVTRIYEGDPSPPMKFKKALG